MEEKRGIKGDGLFLLIIVILNLVSFAGIFGYPESYGTGDVQMHTFRLWFLGKSLYQEGNVPTWSSDQYGGYPFLGIYPPGAYYILSPLTLIISNPVWAIRAGFFIFALFGSIGFYYLAKKIFKKPYLALLATAVFIFSPYRLDKSGVGAVLSEYVAASFVPIIFLLYEKIKDNAKLVYLSLFGLVLGVSALCHHAVALAAGLAIVLFILFDYFAANKKQVLKVIPFLVIGLLMASVFLLPSYTLKDSLNYETIKDTQIEGFKPLSYGSLVTSTHANYIGYLGILGLVFAALVFMKKKEWTLKRYFFTSLVILIVGLHFTFLFPGFVKATIERAGRFFTVLVPLFSIVFTIGLIKLGEIIVNLIHKYEVLKINAESIKRIGKWTGIGLVILLIITLMFTIPRGEGHKVPEGVKEFYQEIKNDHEYYRVEDQPYYTWGLSPILHNKGVLNGGLYQAASKEHFWFWVTSWKLLESEVGPLNIAGIYGAISIKYFISDKTIQLPYFTEIECGEGYCIYENQKWLPYARLANQVIKIPSSSFDLYSQVLNLLAQYEFPFYNTAIISGTMDLENLTLSPDIAPGIVEVTERKGGKIKLEVRGSKGDSYLIVSETYHPNWKATLNGEEVEIYQGVPSTLFIPIKDGTVELVYHRPSNASTGLAISIISTLLLLGLLYYGYKKWKHQ